MPKQTVRSSRIQHKSRVISRTDHATAGRSPRSEAAESPRRRTTSRWWFVAWQPEPQNGKKRAAAAHVFAIYLNLPQRIMLRTARRGCARKYTPYKTAMCEHAAWTLWKPNERGINGEDWSNIISLLTFLWRNDQLSQICLPILVQWSFIWFDPRHLQHLCCEGVSRAPRPKKRVPRWRPTLNRRAEPSGKKVPHAGELRWLNLGTNNEHSR